MTDTTVAETEAPSSRARDAVRSAYDLHIHVGPDVMKRRIDDVTLAERFLAVGLRGFALKSHYTSTAERAQVVKRAVPGIDVIGTLTLNASIGGLNALAVEIAAREGARIVWLPTVDSVNESDERDREYPEGVPKPAWARLQADLHAQGIDAPPVAVVDAAGEPLPELLAVLELIARHGLVLATGHLSRNEIFTVVDAAQAAGVGHVVVTHPEFPSEDIGVDDQVALAEKGAILERCFTTPYTGKCTWEHVFEGIRATGAASNLLSTDLGQPANPPVEDGLALFADRLFEGGFTDDDVHAMTVVQSSLLAGVAAE
ncbi:MAG TPA: DUF6282 family protein [Gaiellaceae bacterium]|nr:DUF6282 family protein [Gaiellaceae bacterium]